MHLSHLLILFLLQPLAYAFYYPYGTNNTPNITQPFCAQVYHENYSAENDTMGPVGYSWPDDVTFLCYSKVVHKTAIAMQVTSIFCCFMLIFLTALDHAGRKKRQGLYNQVLLVMIACGDICYEASHLTDHIRFLVSDNQFYDEMPHSLCIASGFFTFFGIFFSAMIALLLASDALARTLAATYVKSIPLIHPIFFFVIAVFVGFMIPFVPTVMGEYGNSGLWCGPSTQPANLLGFGIPILVFIFLILLVYLLISCFLLRFLLCMPENMKVPPEFKYTTLASLFKVLFYPFVFALVWFPVCVYLLSSYADPFSQHRLVLYVGVLMANQIGIWNFFAYFLSARLARKYVQYKVSSKHVSGNDPEGKDSFGLKEKKTPTVERTT